MDDVTSGHAEPGTEGGWLGAMTLYPLPESVARARRWFRKLTAHYNLAAVDDCVVMISELVTNAICYGEAEEAWLVRVEWRREGDSLRVEIHNPGFPANVQMRQPTANEAHGRGLCLVNALADSWHAGPSHYGGTVVSFLVNKAWKS